MQINFDTYFKRQEAAIFSGELPSLKRLDFI